MSIVQPAPQSALATLGEPQQVIYQTPDARLHSSRYGPQVRAWVDIDLFEAVVGATPPAAALGTSLATMHTPVPQVFYCSTQGEVIQLYDRDGAWHCVNLGAELGSPAASWSALTTLEDRQQVFFVDRSSRVVQYWNDGSSWRKTPLGGAVTAPSRLTAIADRQQVFYVGALPTNPAKTQTLMQHWYDGEAQTWKLTAVSAQSAPDRQPNAAGALASLASPRMVLHHDEGWVELAYYLDGAWQSHPLLENGALRLPGRHTVLATLDSPVQRLFLVTTLDHIELVEHRGQAPGPDGWTSIQIGETTNVTVRPDTPLATLGSPYPAQVYYIDAAGDLNQLWLRGDQWANANITQLLAHVSA